MSSPLVVCATSRSWSAGVAYRLATRPRPEVSPIHPQDDRVGLLDRADGKQLVLEPRAVPQDELEISLRVLGRVCKEEPALAVEPLVLRDDAGACSDLSELLCKLPQILLAKALADTVRAHVQALHDVASSPLPSASAARLALLVPERLAGECHHASTRCAGGVLAMSW